MLSNFFNQISIQYSYKNIDSYLQQRNILFDSLLLSNNHINQSITENNESLLQIAIICKNIQAIGALLNKNADINYCNRRQLTSLDIACEQSDYFIIQLLIEKLKNLDEEYFVNNINKTFNSLNICILNNNIVAFKLLFSYIREKTYNYTIYINDTKYKNNITDTLIHACIHQAKDIIQFLLTQYININQKNHFERTPLNESCIHKSSLQFLNFLIQNGADLNIKDKFGNTPLLNSLVYGNYKIALFLLKFNSTNVNQSNFSNQTPLLLLCQQTNHINSKQNIKLLKKLIKKSADLNFQNCIGQSALMILTRNRNYRFIQILIDNNANINLQDNNGNTCLIYSCIYQDSLTLDWFLSLYPDVDIQNQKGLSALMILCQQNNYQLLQQIFQHNIQFNINQQDFQGKTLLMHSLINLNQYTYLTFILLIDQGCQINTQDKFQKDILFYTLQLYDLLLYSQKNNTNIILHLNSIVQVLFFYLQRYQIRFQLQFCLKYYSFYQNEDLLYQDLHMMNQKQFLSNFLLFAFLNKKKSDYLTRMVISNNHQFRLLLIKYCYYQLNKQ